GLPMIAAAAAYVALRPRSALWSAERWLDLAGSGPPRAATAAAPERHSRDTNGSADEVTGCAELLALAMASGCTAAQAISEVSTTSTGGALVGAAADLRRGLSLTEVLERLATGSAGWHSMATLLAMSAGSGADAIGPMRRLAATERTRVRRSREAAARRLPVLLLLPLAGLVLPAFALVTVVPFAIAGVESFELPPVETTGEPPVAPAELED
ncbi:MAG: type II secretion system F family protein, partial [Microthrixaceae bacterium]